MRRSGSAVEIENSAVTPIAILHPAYIIHTPHALSHWGPLQNQSYHSGAQERYKDRFVSLWGLLCIGWGHSQASWELTAGVAPRSLPRPKIGWHRPKTLRRPQPRLHASYGTSAHPQKPLVNLETLNLDLMVPRSP